MLEVNYTEEKKEDKIEALLNLEIKQDLDHVMWLKPLQVPRVCFSMCYNDQFIFIKYFVSESERRAVVHQTNGPVWEDSCVEFFMSRDNGQTYYNFEFNSLGTRLAGFGRSKTERRFLPVETVEEISTKVEIRKSVRSSFQWNLLVAIPLSLFDRDTTFSLRGKRFSGNFYKCGDALQDPHFLSWSPIDNPEPNFHLPQFFGEISFC